MLYRLGGNAKMGKDNFTKYTLALALHVRPETIESWITPGWLNATQTETGRGKRVVIQADDFCEFCQNHTKDIVGNRLTKEGLDLYIILCPPPHTVPFCPVRDSKKERDAFNEHLKGKFPMSLDECLQRRRFGEAEDILEQIA